MVGRVIWIMAILFQWLLARLFLVVAKLFWMIASIFWLYLVARVFKRLTSGRAHQLVARLFWIFAGFFLVVASMLQLYNVVLVFHVITFVIQVVGSCAWRLQACSGYVWLLGCSTWFPSRVFHMVSKWQSIPCGCKVVLGGLPTCYSYTILLGYCKWLALCFTWLHVLQACSGYIWLLGCHTWFPSGRVFRVVARLFLAGC